MAKPRAVTDEQIEEMRSGIEQYFPDYYAKKYGISKRTAADYMRKIRHGDI